MCFFQFFKFLDETSGEPVVGFDSEFHSVEGVNDKVAVIQVATRYNFIFTKNFAILFTIFTKFCHFKNHFYQILPFFKSFLPNYNLSLPFQPNVTKCYYKGKTSTNTLKLQILFSSKY